LTKDREKAKILFKNEWSMKMKLSKIILSIFVISSLQATSLVKVECDVRGE